MMQIRFIIFSLLAIFYGCSNSQKDKTESTVSSAVDIVNQSMEAHGGSANWKALKAIRFQKQTILFDSAGAEESNVTQYNEFIIKPDLEGSISWVENGDSILVAYKNGLASKYINRQLDQSAETSAKNSVLASLFVLFQPFKLIDDGPKLEIVRQDTAGGAVVTAIRPIYEGSKEGDDEWTFYFDDNSLELIANQVVHNGRVSRIENLSFDTSSRLKLHHHRKSYFIDPSSKGRLLRAEYFYTDYNLEFD